MDAVIPQMERMYAEFNRWLCQPYIDSEGINRPARFDNKRYHIDYDVSAIEALSEDMERKVAWLQQVWQLTPNQVLNELDFDTSENPAMDEVWAPMGRIPIGQSSFGDDTELRELVENYGLKLNGHNR